MINQQLQQVVSEEQIKSSPSTNSLLVSSGQPYIQNNISSPPPERLNKKLLVGIFIIIVGILIIGGGTFAYFNYFQSPEKIVQEMISRLAEIRSLEYSGEVKAEVSAENLLSGSGNILQPTQPGSNKKINNILTTFTGSSDIKNLEDPKSLFSFSTKTDALPQGEFSFGLEIRTISKIIYLKLSDVPNLGFFDLSVLKNQWVAIDTKAVKKQFGLEKIDAQIKEAQSKQDLSLEQKEKIKIAFQQSEIFKITKTLASEKIEGANTHHYKFTISKDGVKKFFLDVAKIIGDKTLTEKELTEFNQGFESVELPEGEIWIGKKDLLPYKISLNSIIKETDKSKTSGKIIFTIFFKNFNKPVQIEVPTPTKTPEEIIAQLFGGFKGFTLNATSTSVIQEDFNKDTDGDGLTDKVEAIYGTNPNKADTDGDGFKDGEEVNNGFNPNGPGEL